MEVKKTYKLYVGGEFIRTESGRYDPVPDAEGQLLANVSRGSRKDLREAVRRARAAQPGWAGRSAYLKGQILYRMAEMLEGRAVSFEELLRETRERTAAAARSEVRAAIDRLVHYAGWSDKYVALLGTVNPVASSYFDFSVPEPTGVVAVVAPRDSSLLGLVSVVAPAIVTGNTAVVVASEERPLPAITLAEVLATSDLPGGVVNLLTGRAAEIAPWLASHMDVNALDLAGVTDTELATELETAAAENLKRVVRPPVTAPDWSADPGLDRMLAFLETKTVWHPVGI